jgi:hypothetical protein
MAFCGLKYFNGNLVNSKLQLEQVTLTPLTSAALLH